MNKKIGLIITIVLIIGAIWYLEKIEVHPTSVGSQNSITIATSSNFSVAGIATVAAADQRAGYSPASEFSDPTGFINTDAFKLSDLVGKKVILIDFWTYSCINCIRTIPYLNAWYQKYHDQGLEIVGVHTPEFDFEKIYSNVQAAVQKFGIQYPVVLDSNYGTWQAYGNLYWPHEYLIDIAGYVVHDHIGEGDYDETEAEIQDLLKERAVALGTSPMPNIPVGVSVPPADLSGVQSPETYFGAERNEFLANGAPGVLGEQTLSEPSETNLNNLYLVGKWNFDSQYATNGAAGAEIIYKYHSAKVFFVADAPNGAEVNVYQDGKPVSAAGGSDVKDGVMSIKESRLYNVISNPDGSGEHTLELIIQSPGLQAFTFTFG